MIQEMATRRHGRELHADEGGGDGRGAVALPPEFINRLDDIVVFHPLDKAQIREIARIQLAGLEKRLAERGLKLALSDSALTLLGDVGFDPVYGARPLKRAIQQQLENPLAHRRSCRASSSAATRSVSRPRAGTWCSAPPDPLW